MSLASAHQDKRQIEVRRGLTNAVMSFDVFTMAAGPLGSSL